MNWLMILSCKICLTSPLSIICFLQEVAEYYSKHTQSPQRWHTPQIIEDLKVCERIVMSLLVFNLETSAASKKPNINIVRMTECLRAVQDSTINLAG